MQSKSETTNPPRSNPQSFTPSNVYSEPWWRGIHPHYKPVPPQAMSGVNASNSSSLERPPQAMSVVNASNSSSLERPNGDSESSEDQSLSNNGVNEEDDDVTKESQPTAPNQPGALHCIVKKKKYADIEIRKESMCLYIHTMREIMLV